ncbi:4-hydroxy-tetrahydrodipicolinate synthase [Arsenophonus symbiont of Ornithomya chloropus]|uniref:4-hydroxy-tetrahydrodipicolinate synthase n=1 Tax=Arsenophonus symbiont of Ornithomya chloropus TaxID=634121 RepID=UPI0032B15A6C
MKNNFNQDYFFLYGSLVAMITPMDTKGKIDKLSLKKLIHYHINNKTKAIVSIGTTGESATLNHTEKLDVVLRTLEYADGKIPIIVNTGDNSTKKVIKLNKSFEKTGVIACLSVTPYYNKPSQEGIYQHFYAIANQTYLPQILYNVPTRTGCDLLPETIAKLSKLKNIIAIKEASGDLNRVTRILRLINKKKFILLSGDDLTALDFIKLGGKGVISVTANIAPDLMAKICELALAGKYNEAEKLNHRLNKLQYQLFRETNPIPIKWACHYLGLINSHTLRLPMTPLTLSSQKNLKKALNIANLKKQ